MTIYELVEKLRFANIYSESQTKWLVDVLKDSLNNHKQIMRIHWYTFEECTGITRGSCAEVHRRGWGHSKETKKLRAFVEDILKTHRQPDLDDYLGTVS